MSTTTSRIASFCCTLAGTYFTYTTVTSIWDQQQQQKTWQACKAIIVKSREPNSYIKEYLYLTNENDAAITATVLRNVTCGETEQHFEQTFEEQKMIDIYYNPQDVTMSNVKRNVEHFPLGAVWHNGGLACFFFTAAIVLLRKKNSIPLLLVGALPSISFYPTTVAVQQNWIKHDLFHVKE